LNFLAFLNSRYLEKKAISTYSAFHDTAGLDIFLILDRHASAKNCRLLSKLFSKFLSEAACDQKYACRLEEGLNDEGRSDHSAGRDACSPSVSIAALHRPTWLAQA
jgi:hypothetical protein